MSLKHHFRVSVSVVSITEAILLFVAVTHVRIVHFPHCTFYLVSVVQVYNEAFYRGLRKTLGDAQLLTPEMSFAWRVFNFDCTTLNPLGLRSGQSRPGEIIDSFLLRRVVQTL